MPVVESGCYPAIPLMEDVELALRLRRLGRLTFLWQRNIVSARRWQGGSSARVRLVLGLLLRYFGARAVGRPDPVALYRRYYGGRDADDATRPDVASSELISRW